jgi:hypothetical protein
MKNDICRQEFEDWIKLLKEVKAEELLKDPYTVWEEAWHIATTLASK